MWKFRQTVDVAIQLDNEMTWIPNVCHKCWFAVVWTRRNTAAFTIMAGQNNDYSHILKKWWLKNFKFLNFDWNQIIKKTLKNKQLCDNSTRYEEL